MDGDHTIERCYEVTAETQASVFAALRRHRVALRRHAAQAEHGRVGHRLPRAGRRAGGRRGHDPLPARQRARRGARHRLPLRRPERRAGHRPPRRDEPPRAAAVAAQLLLRPGAAGAGAQGVEGRDRPTSPPPSWPSTTGPSSTAPPGSAATARRWRPRSWWEASEHDPHRGVDRWWRCPGIEPVHQDARLRRRRARLRGRRPAARLGRPARLRPRRGRAADPLRPTAHQGRRAHDRPHRRDSSCTPAAPIPPRSSPRTCRSSSKAKARANPTVRSTSPTTAWR